MTQSYPFGLPQPLVSGYGVDVNYGLSAVTFERGNTRQRRGVSRQRHVFSLSMILTIPQLWEWQSWANRYGYDWHLMDLQSSFSGAASVRLIPHTVRYISDISVQLVDHAHVQVAVQAEMDLNTLPIGAVIPSGDWYVGGTPASPSSSNSVQAGTPAAPSSNVITAGSPGVPAA